MEILKKWSESLEGFSNALTERINNRLIWSFLFSWTIFNWHILYFLLRSEKEPIDKISLVEKIYFSWGTNFIYPLLIAVAYSTLFPLIRNTVDAAWLSCDRFSKIYFEGKSLLTTEDRDRLIKEIRGIRSQYTREIDDLKETIDTYRETIGEDRNEKVKKNPELGSSENRYQSSNHELADAIEDFTQKSKQQYSKNSSHQSSIDLLTGLISMSLFSDYFEEKIRKSYSTYDCWALVISDVDKFRNVNDQHGHEIGDQLIKQVAKRFEGVFTSEAIVSRSGGESFVALVKCIDNGDLEELLGELQHSLSRPYRIGDLRISITATTGVCMLNGKSPDLSASTELADKALYEAKETKRGSYIIKSM